MTRVRPPGTVQDLVTVDSAEIYFPTLQVRGRIDPHDPDPNVDGDEIPGLVIRTDGFQIGTAELAYGVTYDGQQTNTDAAGQLNKVNDDPNRPSTAQDNDDKLRIGSVLALDDIRIGVRNFEVIFGEGLDFRRLDFCRHWRRGPVREFNGLYCHDHRSRFRARRARKRYAGR